MAYFVDLLVSAFSHFQFPGVSSPRWVEGEGQKSRLFIAKGRKSEIVKDGGFRRSAAASSRLRSFAFSRQTGRAEVLHHWGFATPFPFSILPATIALARSRSTAASSGDGSVSDFPSF
jgi:hypothetical protein